MPSLSPLVLLRDTQWKNIAYTKQFHALPPITATRKNCRYQHEGRALSLQQGTIAKLQAPRTTHAQPSQSKKRIQHESHHQQQSHSKQGSTLNIKDTQNTHIASMQPEELHGIQLRQHADQAKQAACSTGGTTRTDHLGATRWQLNNKSALGTKRNPQQQVEPKHRKGRQCTS
jgi:hypothetical protein